MSSSQTNVDPNYNKQILTRVQLEKSITQLKRTNLELQDEVVVLEELVNKRLYNSSRTAYDFKNVTQAACVFFEVTQKQLRCALRKREVAHARFACFHILKNNSHYSLTIIGDYYNGRDHSSVIHGVEQVDIWLESEHPDALEFLNIYMPMENFLEELDKFFKKPFEK